MRAVGFDEFGGPQVLRVIERATPEPAAGEVLVRVAASTVNPTDLLMRAGRQAAMMTALVPPYIAGMEFAGYVQRLGAGPATLDVGQAVMGVVNPRRTSGGAHAEFISVPRTSVVPIDAHSDLAEAASVPMNGLTARMAMAALELHAGQTVLVTGAAGAVGGYVLQLARRAGLRVIADAKDGDVELVRRLGAEVLVPRGAAMAAAVRRACPEGVDAMVDAALIGDTAAALVHEGGVAVSLRRSSTITDARLRVRYVSVVDEMNNQEALMELAGWLRDHVLTPRVAKRMDMSEAAEAHRLVEQGGVRGRVVLMFGASPA